MSKWTKRKLFSYSIDGRPRRMLLWRKPIYEEWFECAKIAKGMAWNIPREFGDVLTFEFEDWWRHPDHGFELFCEKPHGAPAEMLDKPPAKIADHHLLIDINLNTDQDKLLDTVKKIIKKQQKKEIIYQSNARYQPSKPPKYIKRAHLRECREVWLMSEIDKIKHIEIAERMGFIKKRSDYRDGDVYATVKLSALRRVGRLKKSFAESLHNVTKGMFP